MNRPIRDDPRNAIIEEVKADVAKAEGTPETIAATAAASVAATDTALASAEVKAQADLDAAKAHREMAAAAQKGW